jgi:hypothetical protein
MIWNKLRLLAGPFLLAGIIAVLTSLTWTYSAVSNSFDVLRDEAVPQTRKAQALADSISSEMRFRSTRASLLTLGCLLSGLGLFGMVLRRRSNRSMGPGAGAA